MTLASMTGFASRTGAAAGLSWAWEARSVNGRGLDLRLRLPEGAEALDPMLRKAIGEALARGSVTVSLRLGRGEGAPPARLNATMLEGALAAAEAVHSAAAGRGIAMRPVTAGELLGLRGMFETEGDLGLGSPEVQAALTKDIPPLVGELAAARRAEGRTLAAIIAAQIDAVAELAAAARAAAEARAARSGDLLRERVAAVLEAAGHAVDEARLAQELALLAVKADVTEELDRLDAHVGAARALVAKGGAVGRKLDFLMQEFNREANTLCSKAQSVALTAIGLEMKVAIDQMREQVQNVE